MYYEKDDDYYERRDWIHVNDVPDTDKMAELLEVVVKQLYTSFDEDTFQDKLEDLCDMLGVKMPTGDLTIERTQRWAKTA
jgi:non-homologous end joining protein Ku